MANRTVKDARSIRGTNPQYLVEKIIRSRVYDSRYWKEECFALTAELLVDKAMDLKYIGGVYGGNIKPAPFLCLVLKMLQIQPEKDIIVEFIKNEEFKYVRALGAIYMRLVGTSLDCYKYLEPLLNDYRKLRRQSRQGQFELVYMDELIDELLREERLCDVILPRIQKRHVLEENNELEPRISALDDDLDDGVESSSEDDEAPEPPDISSAMETFSSRRDERVRRAPVSPRHRRSRSREREVERDRRHRSRDRERPERDKKRRRSVERRHRSRSRSASPPAVYHRHRDEEHHRSYHSGKYKDREREKDRDRERTRHRDRRGRHETSGMSRGEQEISEANSLRARLGLPPLRP